MPGFPAGLAAALGHIPAVPSSGRAATKKRSRAKVAPVLDRWACCDKCDTWRILPEGTPEPGEDQQWFCSDIGFECPVEGGGGIADLAGGADDEGDAAPAKRVKS